VEEVNEYLFGERHWRVRLFASSVSYTIELIQSFRYTYEVCLFGEAKQIPNKGGSTFSLGYVFLLGSGLLGKFITNGPTYVLRIVNSPPGTLHPMLRSVPLSITLNKLIPVVLGAGMDPNAVLQYVFKVPLTDLNSLKLIRTLKFDTVDPIMWN